MKTIVMLIVSCVILAPVTKAQGKAVHFKKLQEYLPAIEMKGFERKKPTGQTQSSMGMTTSEAKVRYVTIQKEDAQGEEEAQQQSVEITLSDLAGIPYGQMAAMQYQQDFENETEDGYEKSVVVKKTYRGKESTRTGDYKSCSLEFIVGNRFTMKLDGEGFSDVSILRKLAESVDLAKLEKLTP